MNHLPIRIAALTLLAATLGCTTPPTAAPTAATPAASAPSTPKGEVTGSADTHTAASRQAMLDNAWLVLPASATGGVLYEGLAKSAPAAAQRVPVVVFMHGSSGVAPAIKQWQKWLAQSLGVASIAPDSMQLPNRLNYKSPIDKATYERIHALRGSELAAAMSALPQWAWADAGRVVIAGTSEGATSVARYTGAANAPREVGRIVYSWSCEPNYFVAEPRNALPASVPVLNVMSSTDPYFSRSNAWLGAQAGFATQGHCGAALEKHPQASVVLIPGAPHTLFNLPQAQWPTLGFLRMVMGLR